MVKIKKKILSLVLAGALLVGATPAISNAQGQWSSQNGKWYYYNNGSWMKGWSQIGGQWYYFNSNAEMITGWLNDSGTWYYLNSSGVMHTGWLGQGGKGYYMNSNGQMVTGTYEIDGKIHSFNSSGQWLGEVTSANGNTANNQSSSESTTVWRAGASGKYYHASEECSNMKNPKKMTLKEALDKGLEKCPKCHKN